MAGLAMALGCSPAQGGGSTKVNVSAVILARVTCTFTGSAGVCTGNAATTYRIRRTTDARAGTVVLVIEP